uniref:Predicted protein n=1 Tax=Hordeum vulgare subsp. vulgare TaxID=112509 RepID=F2CRZ0_HORVV|nr:predicted protein [Hordeum vulgare subsp. vulgare]
MQRPSPCIWSPHTLNGAALEPPPRLAGVGWSWPSPPSQAVGRAPASRCR